MKENTKVIAVRSVHPEIDGGRYPVKREVSRRFDVYADVYSKKKVTVWLKYRNLIPENSSRWKKVPMSRLDNGTWKGSFNLDVVGRYQYTVEAGIAGRKRIVSSYGSILEVVVDPVQAGFASWYTMWARSQGKNPKKSATFKDMEDRLSYVKGLGFDVVFLSPIHPIGRTNRKGRNGKLTAGPDEPGSPYAIGDETGGHKAVHHELGTLEDFRHFVKKANDMGMGVAMDVVFQCSPDHSYVKEHPGWFHYRPDGTIQCAENLPKKYEDVYPLNFCPEGKEEKKKMWDEMKDIFVFWIKQGVKTFRVDNPHTKPIEFWEWVINEIKKEYPGVVFLAEAFVYYEKLELHAKVGFSQSYTYFTWRNGGTEIIEYFSKLTNSYLKEFLRGNLFTNTPNILSEILQKGGRPAFKMRAALASTLSSLWGIYNGYELCENKALPGKEDYMDSEMFEYKVWDWDRQGNIKDYISKLNRIRKENPALRYYDNLRFYNSVNGHILCYGKTLPDRSNMIVVVANLDPFNKHFGRVAVPLEDFGIGSGEEYDVRDLITDKVYTWKGRENYVELDPQVEPVHIFRIERKPIEDKR
jgi:starch synthase (maltosyl-transferring)